jgi:uncharacterized protein YndB with AHSA1/START domain/DNA-binding transcriptional ArsR family regulator
MLLDGLNAHNGQTLRELCAGLEMARQSVSKHLAVLETAGLVTTVRRGREKLHYLNAAPISDIAERWISRYDQPRVEALADLKKALEDTEVEAPSFVYTTYIRATPERLWQGLTDPAFTRRYWQTELHTDWAKGSPVTWNNHGVLISDPGSVVLESDPYRRLSYTWHTMTPELAEKFGWDQEFAAKLAGEPRSKVTFDIEPVTQGVKLAGSICSRSCGCGPGGLSARTGRAFTRRGPGRSPVPARECCSTTRYGTSARAGELPALARRRCAATDGRVAE